MASISDHARACTIAFADEICAGRYPFLGYGTVDLGLSPRWDLDFISGLSWPQVPSDNPKSIRHDGSDVKVPYELSRLQFLPVLGKAHFLTADERYRTRAKDLLSDWIVKNPPGVGINWTMAMEVALRGMSICFLLNLLSPLRPEEHDWLRGVTRSLWEHMLYIEAHNEFSHLIRSNHYLSNIVGLYCLSTFLNGPGTRAKRAKYRRLIENEILHQVYEDGGDYEASSGYHVLVTQMFTSALLLMKTDGQPIKESFVNRLAKMYAFIDAIADEAGELPCLGDCDDGRTELIADDLEQMIHLPVEQRTSLKVSNLLGIGSALFGNCHGTMDDAIWHGLNPQQGRGSRSLSVEGSTRRVIVFPQSGIAAARNARAELLFLAMPNGIHGKGSHTHNDKLAIVAKIGGEILLCDSGTYCYLRDVSMRNQFRKTAAHNTVLVDGYEQNSLPSSLRQAFYLADEADVSTIECTQPGSSINLKASHTGYVSKCGVTHTRRVHLGCENRFEVEDVLEGSGSHSFEFNLHFGPAWRITSVKNEDSSVICQLEGPQIVTVVLRASAALQFTAEKSEFSTTFGGTCRTIDKLRLRAQTVFPARLTTRIAWSLKSETSQATLPESFVENHRVS